MERKVIKQGHNTLTITLPIKWVKNNNINSGDILSLDEQNTALLISKTNNDKSKKKKTISIAVGQNDEFLMRFIISPYSKGCTSIKINYSNKAQYKKIVETVKYLVGFEIVEQTSNTILIEEISNSTEDKYNNVMIRLFHVVNSFLRDIQTTLKDNYNDMERLLELEVTCDRLSLYCRRLLNINAINSGMNDKTGMYHIICLLEQSADELRKIVEYFLEKKRNYKYESKMDEYFKLTNQILENAFKTLNNFLNNKDTQTLINLTLEQKILVKKINPNDFQSLNKDNIYVFWHLLNVVSHIQHMSEEFF